jgi:hypothetical protein
MTLPPRLSHLIELADQGPTLRAALAEEIADLLAAWPGDYPADMRSVCEALFARVMGEADAATREKLVRRKAGARTQAPNRVLIAARKGTGVSEKLAQLLDVPQAAAEQILKDASGKALAIAAKAAQLPRSEFSALALLAHPRTDRAGAYALLDIYDGIAAPEVTRGLRTWRAPPGPAK